MFSHPIFQSKRARMGLALILTALITIQFEATEAVGEVILDNLVWLIGAFVAGYSVTDVARLWLGREGSIAYVSSVTQTAIDEFESATGQDFNDKLEDIIVAGVTTVVADYAKTE